MLKIEGLTLPPDADEASLARKAAKVLRLPEAVPVQVLRRSVDARETVSFVYSVAVTVPQEAQVLRRCRDSRVSAYRPEVYRLPEAVPPPEIRPVVVGAGPAGLFCALTLAECGARPILLERGQPVEQRQRDVDAFWRTGVLDPSSNVQFGEGGAGAFSDGKLNTGTRDPRHRWITETLVSCGAPDSILTDAKPHVGTDRFHTTLIALRQHLVDLGAEIRFGHQVAELDVSDGALRGLHILSPEGPYTLPARRAVLALGHSARDTVEALYGAGVLMVPKAFAVGVRIEHLQRDMDARQYRQYAGHPSLPPTSYKLSCHLEDGRSAFSLCVCPGGQVVAAASEERQVVTNGMSEYARDGENINGGLLVNVTPADFGSSHPLAGIAFQRRLERAAYDLGGGGYRAPAQRVEDFLLGRPSAGPGRIRPTYRPSVTFTDLRQCLPEFVWQTMAGALPLLERKVRGYADGDAILTAVETRSSSPVRLPRDDSGQANIRGVYPCGEGAGYAGGILSAAADGMRCAEHILEVYR